ncbi:MAG TPA: hypothetical protein VH186_00910 [Chloroflexia bacterium]|nr:hypothetical protein [Chloroflexia bacterium]
MKRENSEEPDLTANRADLKQKWLELALEYTTEKDALLLYGELEAAYSQAGRYYHNLQHIRHVLETLDNLKSMANNYPAIALAAWFHDFIYDPKASDNEEKSAEYASKALLKTGFPLEVVNEAASLILCTKTHRIAASDLDGAMLLDADLAILGANAQAYAQYQQAIRQEYGWLPDETYRAGRSKVLASFLERPRIYHTAPLFEKLEKQARLNLKAEIAALS